jgi:hypothetical protein
MVSISLHFFKKLVKNIFWKQLPVLGKYIYPELDPDPAKGPDPDPQHWLTPPPLTKTAGQTRYNIPPPLPIGFFCMNLFLHLHRFIFLQCFSFYFLLSRFFF